MIVLPNVYIDILRSPTTSQGGTGQPLPHLSRVPGHLTRIKDAVLMPLATSAFRAEYEVYVETAVDIQRGDVVTNIIRSDNEQPYLNNTLNETWRVLDAVNSSPGFLEYRDCPLGRIVGGGPIQ